jgi:hypothetical protein
LTNRFASIRDGLAELCLDRRDAILGSGHIKDSSFPMLDRHAAKPIRDGPGE